MSNVFVVLSSAGPGRDRNKRTRQQPFWDEHAAFIDALTDGFIMLGGPFEADGGAMLIVRAESEEDVRSKLQPDPWYIHGILALQSIRQWEIFVNTFDAPA